MNFISVLGEISPQSSLDSADSMVASNSEPDFSQLFPQKSNACKWLLRKPNNESNHEELKQQQLKGPVKFWNRNFT